MSCKTVKLFVESCFVMKKNSFLKIRIRIVTNMYIVCALSGALSVVLSGALGSALSIVLSGNCRALHSTPQKSPIFKNLFRKKYFQQLIKRKVL
jgi:hypothetical protein